MLDGCGGGLDHVMCKRIYRLNIFPPSQQGKSSQVKNVLPELCQNETNMFYASLTVWTGLLGVMTYHNLASAHLPLLWVIFPLLRVLIWENVIQKNSCMTKNIGQFMVVYLSSVLVPVCFTSYAFLTVLELFVPIMGRSGSQTIPDVFIAVIVAVLVIVLTSYLVSTCKEDFLLLVM
jgi:hypothetical protein